ncbi:MAG: hypothetical protein RLZZ584_1814 [Pseudomonadota bacterium]
MMTRVPTPPGLWMTCSTWRSSPLLCVTLAALVLATSLLAGAARAAGPAATAAAAALQRQIQLTRSIVKIEARTASGYALGTGVVVGPGQVVASCHVTRDAQAVDALYTGLRLRATAQRANVGHDLCVLDVPRLDAPVVPLAGSGSLQPGQAVVALGFSGGLGLATSRGEVISLHDHDGARVIRSSTGFISGASGGGLFNDAGELVGVLTFRLRGADRHYFSVPADWLATLVTPASPGSQGTPPVPTQAIAPLAGHAFWEARPGATLVGMPDFLVRIVRELEQSQPGVAVAGAASTPAMATEASAAEETSPEPSLAERLLFMQPHLAGLALPAQLVYDIEQSDSGDTAHTFSDTARVSLSAGADGKCCDASGDFLSGARALRLPDVPGVTSNPLLLYFLEFEVRRLQQASKGQAAHFRRRIRLALVDAATVRDIEIEHGGRRLTAQEISITPFLADPYRTRFEQEATRRYRFVLSDALPGRFHEIAIDQPGRGDSPRRLSLRIRLRAAAPQ